MGLALALLVGCAGNDAGEASPAPPPPPPLPQQDAQGKENARRAPSALGEQIHVQLSDDADVCLFGESTARRTAKRQQLVRDATFKAKSPVYLKAWSRGCMNFSSDSDAKLSCKVVREGNTLRVSSNFELDHMVKDIVTEDCRRETAHCATPKLEAGRYVVQYGERALEVDVPGTTAQPCFITPGYWQQAAGIEAP